MHSQFNLSRARIVILALVCALASLAVFEHRPAHAVSGKASAAVHPHNRSQLGLNEAAESNLSLRGEEAVAHLKEQGTFESLAEAMTTARYSIIPVARAMKCA